MDEIIEDDEGRAAAVFEDRLATNAALTADVAAIMGDDEVIGLDDLAAVADPLESTTDDEFDVIDIILEAPPELLADPEAVLAFEEILQSEGAAETEIADILAGDGAIDPAFQTQVAAPEALALTDAEPTITNADALPEDEGPTTALDAFADDGAEAADGDAADAELLANANADVGVEAQTGVTDGDTAAGGDDAAAMDACPAMMMEAEIVPTEAVADDDAGDTNAATDTEEIGETANDAEGNEAMTGDDETFDVGMDADTDTTAGDCDLSAIDWTTPGPNGLSPLGEVVQALQNLIDLTGNLFARFDQSPCFSPCDAANQALMNDMADLAQMDALADADMGGTDDDVMG